MTGMTLSNGEALSIIEMLEQIRPIVERVSLQTLDSYFGNCPHCGAQFMSDRDDPSQHEPNCLAFQALDRLHTIDASIKTLRSGIEALESQT